jgi:hypothetical protein
MRYSDNNKEEQITMTTDTKQVSSSQKVQLPRAVARTGYFLLHFLEMCVVMCMGGIAIVSALLRWSGPLIGYPELKTQFPELSTFVLALWLTLLMIVWMRFRGHEWRPTLEMASTSIVAMPLLFGAAWLGVIPKAGLYPLECGLACAFMLIPMLFRLDHYTGHHGSHSSHQPHTAEMVDEHSHHAHYSG